MFRRFWLSQLDDRCLLSQLVWSLLMVERQLDDRCPDWLNREYVDVVSDVDASPYSGRTWTRCCNAGDGLQLELVAWSCMIK